jgi:hypothetical protein
MSGSGKRHYSIAGLEDQFAVELKSIVHDFLKFQIQDHQTGDSLEVQK